jgi:hypothetical protein
MAAIMDRPYDHHHHDTMRRAAIANGTVRRVVRAAVQRDYAPPDPYAEGLAVMREDLRRSPGIRQSPCPFEDKSYTGENGVPPDGYKIAIERMKKEKL